MKTTNNQTENKSTEKLDQVMEQLENGVRAVYTSGKFAEYLSFLGKFHRYSANNTVLIWAQCPDASLVAGFQAWKNDHKRNVKRGEKAIRILAPCPHKMTVEQVDPVTGEKYMKEIRWNTYRPVCVFDISQTEGAPVPSLVEQLTGTVEGFEMLFKRLEAMSPVPIAFEKMGEANGYFHPLEHRIAIKTGMSNEQTIKTAVHEIAHAILHNQEDGEEKDADRHIKEVQAESVAYVVCSRLGIDASDYTFGYVAGWAQDKDVKALTENLDIIKKTASAIIDALTANGAEATAPAVKTPEKASTPAPKKAPKKNTGNGKKPTKKAPEKPSATAKALEKWSISAGKRLDKLMQKNAARYANTPEGCYFLDYYNPYYGVFIPGYQVQTVKPGMDEIGKLPQLCKLTEAHNPVVEVTPGTSIKGNPVSRYTNSEGVQMWVSDKFRRYFPKAAKCYVDKRIGTLILTLGEGDAETVIGAILPINLPANGAGWQPLKEAKAA